MKETIEALRQRFESELREAQNSDAVEKLRVAYLGKKGSVTELLKGLKSAGGYLRRELGRTLNLRNTPELSFVPDDSIDHGARILSMLRDPEVVKPVNPDNHYGEDQEEDEE